MTDFDTVVRTRRSVRGFSRREVPLELVREALELAQHSPSNCNAQPWRVFIASGARREALRERLLEAYDGGTPAEDSPTPRFEAELRKRQIACAVELYGKMGVARDDRPGRRDAERRNYALFDAPHVAIVCMDAQFGVGVALDVGCWLQSFLLALWSRGVAACPQAALRAYGETIKAELGIPSELRVLCGVSFGFEDASVPANQARMGRAAWQECITLVE